MQGFPVMQVVEYRVPEDPAPIPPVLRRSCWLRKYVFLCIACGGLAALLGALFLTVYFMLRSYTSSLNYFETVPTYVPAAMLMVTGLIVMCLAGRRNRFGYLMKLCGGCCLVCAVLCVVVTITTTVIHMNRLQTLRECVYTLKTQTCTCYSVILDSAAADRGDEGIRYVFNSTPDCEVVHGTLYSCLRAMFGLSVIGILVCIFSCMLVYQLLSHEKKKMYWEQLELRCRYLYRQQRTPHHCSCCEECRYPELFPWELMDNRYWAPGRVGNLYSPNPGEENTNRRAPSGWSWRRLPWNRNTPPATSRECTSTAVQNYRNSASSPDSQYGFSSHPATATNQQPESGPVTVSASIETNPSSYIGQRSPNTGGSTSTNQQQPPNRQQYGPFVMDGSGGPNGGYNQQQQYYFWGPPPPYSNPHSHCNSPARRVPMLNILQSSAGKEDPANPSVGGRVQHHHHHHHHCQQQTANNHHQQQQTSADHRTNRCIKDDNLPMSDVDADKRQKAENYVNSNEAELSSMNPSQTCVADLNPDSQDNILRVNTIPVRKTKKRLDSNAVQANANSNLQYLDNPKNSAGHKGFAGNTNLLFNNQACQMDHYHHPGLDEESELENGNLLLRDASIRLAGDPQSRITYLKNPKTPLICPNGASGNGKTNEASESEVYFADVSSCCNVSVKNEGLDSSLYDEAVDVRTRTAGENLPPLHHRNLHLNLHNLHRIQQDSHHHYADNAESIIDDDQELTSNCFSYQRQPANRRLPFPLPFHDDGELSDDEVRKPKMDSLDHHMGRQMNLDPKNTIAESTDECEELLFQSPMSISTPSSFLETVETVSTGFLTNSSSSELGSISGIASTTPTVTSENFYPIPPEKMYYEATSANSYPNSDSEFVNCPEQLFLAPDEQYDTIAQQTQPQAHHSPPTLKHSHVYQQRHQQNYPNRSGEDFLNGNSANNNSNNNNVPGNKHGRCQPLLNNSPVRKHLQLPLHVVTASSGGSVIENLYQTATSTEEDDSEPQQRQSNCYSDATMDSGCHSGSEFITRRRGGSTRTSTRGARNLGTRTDDKDEKGEDVTTIRSVNV